MKKVFGSQRFLAIYSGILTVAFAITIVGASLPRKKRPSSRRSPFNASTLSNPTARCAW
jgi:hypothetical protein